MIVKEKTVTIDANTRKVIDVKSRLTTNDKALLNPRRRIYITKPQYRNHDLKKETEDITATDMHIVEDRFLPQELKKIFGIPEWKRVGLRKLCDSPYIYNADIKMETLVRIAYEKFLRHEILHFTKGYLDIEASMLGCDRINAMTYIHENTVYTVALKDFMKIYDDKKKFVRDANEKDIRRAIEKHLGKFTEDGKIHIVNDKMKKPVDVKLDFHFKICENELELLLWIFNHIHKCESDFIYIWNISYDVPKIASRLQYYGHEPKEVFSHPSVPPQWRHFYFKEDKKKTQHMSDKWHWVSTTGMSQFVDQMLLYARIRKAERKKSKYSLEAICQEELGIGKLTLEDDDEVSANVHLPHRLVGTKEWHVYMQQYNFVEYVVYNIQDVLLLKFLEDKNNDTRGLYSLTEHSGLSEFSKQSSMLKDSYYKFALDRGRVFAATGENMKGPYDDLIGKQGGAVLRADLCRDIGMRCIKQKPEFESMVLTMCSDLDYKAIYPSLKSGYGISKETKISTTVAIQGQPQETIEHYYGAIATPEENAVWVGHQYFGLPNYEEMANLIRCGN